MPTSPYYDSSGKRLPSVTQILSASWSKGDSLIEWANREGLAGRSHTVARDIAADAGTASHSLVLERMGGPASVTGNISDDSMRKAQAAVYHATPWLARVIIEPRIVEEALVSDSLGYGGTPDWYGIIDGKHVVVDIKTGKSIYPQHWVQLSAYTLLLRELGHPVDETLIVHLPTTLSGHAKTKSMSGDELLTHIEAWHAVHALYNLQLTIGF